MAQAETSAGAGAKRSGPSEAAAVLLVRRAPRLEVYWIERSPLLSYLGGFHAFPGGRVGREDRAVPVAGIDDPQEAVRRAAAARELFEEVGVLLAGAAPGCEARALRPDERPRLRAALIAETLSFADLLRERGLVVDGTLLRPAGRWISPPFTPRGFDTRFYLATCPAGETPYVLPGELAAGAWIDPAAGMEAWRRGEVLLAAPVKTGLAGLARLAAEVAAGGGDSGADWEALLARYAGILCETEEARGGPIERVEVLPGIVLLPLATPTLPPATHTNCYVLGAGECLIVDPGSADGGEQAALDAMLERLAAEGRRPVAITLTHAHEDHTGGVEALRRRLGVPLWTHPADAARLGAERALADGERLRLDGGRGAPWALEVLFTPGHTRDHLAFFERARGVLVAGDMISGLSTVVIDPPDGDLVDYLASLRRLAELPVRSLFPGHGPPSGGARERLVQLIEHRGWREGRVIEELRAGPATIAGLVPRVYADVAETQWRWARRSLLAHLQTLERAGRAARDAGPDEPEVAADERGRWRLVES